MAVMMMSSLFGITAFADDGVDTFNTVVEFIVDWVARIGLVIGFIGAVQFAMREIQGRFGGKTLKHRAETREQLESWIKDTWNDNDSKSGDNITFFNACKAYITRRSALAETTRHTYTIIAQSYFGSLHDKPIMKLTREEIFAAVNTEIERGIAQKTLKTALTFLSCVCNEYEVPAFTRKLQADINRYSQHCTNKGRKAADDWENAPTAAEVARWAADTDSIAAISILLDLHSLRSEETRGLQYRDVFEQGGNCYVNICRTRSVASSRDVYRDSTKTENSTRKILIDRRLYDLIHAQPHESDSDFVICVSYKVYRAGIKKAMSEHGADWITPHDLRHIFKTEHIGDPIATAVGGWTNKGSVAESVYTHIKQSDKDKLMSAYSASLLDAYEGKETPAFTVTACTA